MRVKQRKKNFSFKFFIIYYNFFLKMKKSRFKKNRKKKLLSKNPKCFFFNK